VMTPTHTMPILLSVKSLAQKEYDDQLSQKS
jgi:hypothetical protein